jgi:hypothetical protein
MRSGYHVDWIHACFGAANTSHLLAELPRESSHRWPSSDGGSPRFSKPYRRALALKDVISMSRERTSEMLSRDIEIVSFDARIRLYATAKRGEPPDP